MKNLKLEWPVRLKKNSAEKRKKPPEFAQQKRPLLQQPFKENRNNERESKSYRDNWNLKNKREKPSIKHVLKQYVKLRIREHVKKRRPDRPKSKKDFVLKLRLKSKLGSWRRLWLEKGKKLRQEKRLRQKQPPKLPPTN